MIAAFGAFSASAKDEYSRNVNTLPAAARTVIKKNFKADVNIIKIDKEFGRVKDYEVVLTDGTEVKFDSAGNWEEVETGAGSSVPQAFMPAPMREYLKKNFKGLNVVGIEKDRKGYEVTLVNHIDLKFDSCGNFLKFDD